MRKLRRGKGELIIHPRSERPRVGVDLRALVRRPTGIGIHTLALLTELARRGEFELVGLAHAPLHDRTALDRVGVAVEIDPAPLGVLWQQWALPRRLARGDLDLFWSPLLTLPARLPIPAIVTIHDLAVLHHPKTLTWKIRWSLRPFLKRTIASAARVVTVSQSVADDIARIWPAARARTVVIPNGVATEFSPADDAAIATIRARLSLPDRYLLYVGTVEPRKNVDLLVDAWERLRREREDAPALLVAGPEGWGSGATERRLRALAPRGLRRLGHVERAHLIDLMRAATIFVYPSFYEGFGMPALEALACGVPVVVANRSSLPEVVGDAGFLFDPDAPDDLFATLVRLLDSPADRAAARHRGPRRARTFTWEVAAEKLSSTLRDVLAERPGARKPRS